MHPMFDDLTKPPTGALDDTDAYRMLMDEQFQGEQNVQPTIDTGSNDFSNGVGGGSSQIQGMAESSEEPLDIEALKAALLESAEQLNNDSQRYQDKVTNTNEENMLEAKKLLKGTIDQDGQL